MQKRKDYNDYFCYYSQKLAKPIPSVGIFGTKYSV